MEETQSEIEKTGDELFRFAIDRSEVTRLAQSLPELSSTERARAEHELMILRIISVGWSLSYYMPGGPLKTELTTLFWQSLQTFSEELTRTTELLIKQDIVFFNTVRNRFDTYLEKMQEKVDAPEPAVVIGPEFARACGDSNNIHMVMAGSRMFIGTVGEVKTYLESLKLR